MPVSRTSAVAAALLLVAGCTGSGLSENEEIARASIAEALTAEYDGLDSDCVAELWVTEIGIAAFQEAEVLGANLTTTRDVRDAALSDEDAAVAVDAMASCNDLTEVATAMVTDLFEPTDEQSACIGEAVTNEAARAWVTADLSGSVADNIFVVAGRGCMSTPQQDARAVSQLTATLQNGRGFTREQSRCVAEGLVETIGVYELTAAEVLTETGELRDDLAGTPLNETDATLAADATLVCVPVEDSLAGSLPDEGPARLREQFRACVTGALTDEVYRDYLIGSYMGRPTLDPTATQELADCLRPLLEERED